MLNSMDFFNLSRANLWDSCSQNHISRVSFKLLSKLKIDLNYDQASIIYCLLSDIYYSLRLLLSFDFGICYSIQSRKQGTTEHMFSLYYGYSPFYYFIFFEIWEYTSLTTVQSFKILCECYSSSWMSKPKSIGK
jgi:hypothetical protein